MAGVSVAPVISAARPEMQKMLSDLVPNSSCLDGLDCHGSIHGMAMTTLGGAPVRNR